MSNKKPMKNSPKPAANNPGLVPMIGAVIAAANAAHAEFIGNLQSAATQYADKIKAIA